MPAAGAGPGPPGASLPEQRLAYETALASRSGRAGEQRAALVDDELAEGVVALAEAALDRDELARVALVGEEEKADVDVVGAAQEHPAAVRVRAGEPDVGVGGDDGVALLDARVEISLVELVLAPERGAALLVAADDALLLVDRGRVPVVELHADPAGDEIAAA